MTGTLATNQKLIENGEMKRQSLIIDPDLLETSARAEPLKIFLCGPGFSSSGFDVRGKIKDFLEDRYKASVFYGEDLEDTKPRNTTLVDLQTLEAQFAHTVDFTILMLDSPGAIAELGTFSMIPNIMARLFVVISHRYHGSNSYIARGPLSLISCYSTNNIIYYNDNDERSIFNGLMYPVCLYKFVKSDQGYLYYQNAINKFRGKNFGRDDYIQYFDPFRKKFVECIILAAINILHQPTFTELVSQLGLEPDDVSGGLHGLFAKGAIEKVGNRAYRARNGYSDSVLRHFSSTALSKRRAQILATA